MDTDASFVEQNRRELDRMRGIVERASDDDLRRPVHDAWSVAEALGHIAFWDARAIVLAKRMERGIPFTPDDDEPDEVDWINDSALMLIQAIEPREVARLALRLAEEADRRVAALPPEKMWPADPSSPLYPLRADHRGEHVDLIEKGLG